MAFPYSVWHVQITGVDSSTRVVSDAPCLNAGNVWEFRDKDGIVAWFPAASVLYIKRLYA